MRLFCSLPLSTVETSLFHHISLHTDQEGIYENFDMSQPHLMSQIQRMEVPNPDLRTESRTNGGLEELWSSEDQSKTGGNDDKTCKARAQLVQSSLLRIQLKLTGSSFFQSPWIPGSASLSCMKHQSDSMQGFKLGHRPFKELHLTKGSQDVQNLLKYIRIQFGCSTSTKLLQSCPWSCKSFPLLSVISCSFHVWQ